MVGHERTNESEARRVLIVDDHPVVREGLRVLLSREVDFVVCGEAGTAAEALKLARKESPDGAIIDVLLSDENGLELIRKLKALNPAIRMLACSMHDDELYAERSLAAGALGYINKRAGLSQIIDAIRTVMSGEVYLSNRIKQRILNRSVAPGWSPLSSPIETLSNRELEIFQSIGKGMSTTEISQLLNLSNKTIESHRQNIRRHLQFDNTSKLAREAAQWVLENG